jgi:hypothetical protein
MKVADLQVGELYKIRSDRETHVVIRRGYLDVHLGSGLFKTEAAKIRPMDHLIYLGKDHLNTRWINYRGKKLRAYPNIWQHITPLEEE